ncbi:MAG: helix-turn-helix domain-containing protein [Accumulibacter sp.]
MIDGDPFTGATDEPTRAAAAAAALLPERLRLLIGSEPVAAFARRCGLSESVLRTYLKDGRMPPIDKAAAIAAAAGVSLGWLAGGAPAVAAGQADYAVRGAAARGGKAIDAAVLAGIVQAVLEAQGAQARPERIAARVVDLYQQAIAPEPDDDAVAGA